MTPLFDVAIYDQTTLKVSSIAAASVPKEEAEDMRMRLSNALRRHLRPVIVDANTVRRGDIVNDIQLADPPMAYPNPQKRREAGVCVDCEYPHVVATHRCQKCAAIRNEGMRARYWRSQDRARAAESPV